MAKRIVDYRKKLTLFSSIWLNDDLYFETVKEAIDKKFDIMDGLCEAPLAGEPYVKLDSTALEYLIRSRNERGHNRVGHVFTEEKLWEVFEDYLKEYV